MNAQDRVYISRKDAAISKNEWRRNNNRMAELERYRSAGIITREGKTYAEYIHEIEQAVRKLQGKENA